MYNGHGDVTGLVSASGSVIASYYYDAFGNILEQSGNFSNPYRYAGYEYDGESELYYLKARYYDPAIARFMQEDTYRGDMADPLSLNLYTYCRNEPMMYFDPTGHWEVGDEKYDAKTQAAIAKATTDYFNAKANNDAKGMADAHNAAEAARTSGTTSNSNVNSTGQAYTNTITSSSKNDKNGNQYMEASDWGNVLESQAIITFNQIMRSSSGISGGSNASATNSPSPMGVTLNASQSLALDSYYYYCNAQRQISSGNKSTNRIIPSQQLLMLGAPGDLEDGKTQLAELYYKHDAILYFISRDEAAKHFAMTYTLASAEIERELFAYIYAHTLSGYPTMYSYSDVWKLDSKGGNIPSTEKVFGDRWFEFKVVAWIHTHGGTPSKTLKNKDGKIIGELESDDHGHYRFSWDYDQRVNAFQRSISRSYVGMYLAPGNGTLQFVPANAQVSDTMVKVISTEMPIVDGAVPYQPGSEQIYYAVEKARPWHYYANPFNWGKPSTYIEYVVKPSSER